MVLIIELIIKILETFQAIFPFDIKTSKQVIIHINRWQIYINKMANVQNKYIQIEIFNKIEWKLLLVLSGRFEEWIVVECAVWRFIDRWWEYFESVW